MNWLISSRMVYVCKAVSLPEAPLAGFQIPDIFKLYINDTGLLCSLLGVRLPDLILDADFQYKGVIVENYVASQLSAFQAPLFYWRDESRYEVDFLIDTADGIIPVEVKSGKNKRSASMAAYIERFSPRYAIRITANNFGDANGIKSVPLYAVFCLSAE
jgi:predicted AAA+ superfamily ATPase